MKSVRLANGFFAVGMVAAIASFFVSASPARGWLCLGGFSALAMHNVLSEWPGQPSRRGTMYGFYMLVAAANLSSPYLWPAEPTWLKEALAGVFVFAVMAILVEQKKSASVGGSFWAPLKAPPTRSRVIRGALLGLVMVALPPLFFFWVRK